MLKLRKHIYLVLAIASILAIVILRQLYFGAANTDLYVEHIKSRLVAESEIADNDIFLLKKRMKEDSKIEFGNLMLGNKYPLFVFKDKNLVFWSDNTFHINYYDVFGYFDERCIETRNGIYIAKKSILLLDNQDYEVVAFIPIRRRYQIENEFLSPTLNPDIFSKYRIQVSITKGNGIDIYNKFNVYLFSVNFPQDFTYHADKRWMLLVLIGFSVLFIVLQLRKYLKALLRRRMTVRATALLTVGLVSIRAIMLIYEIPYDYLQYSLFEPKIFASSFINPSLGDLFLNTLCLLIIILFFYGSYPRVIRYKKIVRFSDRGRAMVAIIAVLISYFAILGVHHLLNTIYQNSSISIDITQGINFPSTKIICFIIFVMLATGYFFVAHICSKILIKLSPNTYDMPFRFVLGSLLFYSITLALDIENMTLFNINAIYMLFASFLSLPLSLRRSDYSTYIYLFVCAVIVASVGAYTIYKSEEQRIIADKHNFADYLKLENDLLGEYMLNEMTGKVQEDKTIQNKIKDPSKASVDWIIRKLKRVFLKRYFDKYDTDILLFDAEGSSYNYRKKYNVELTLNNQEKYKTEYPNIYFINDLSDGVKSYVVFIPIIQQNTTIGHIVLKLKLRRIIPNSIHPNFFVAQTPISAESTKNYSYAVYSDDDLLLSAGDFRFDNNFLARFVHEKGFLREEIRYGGFHHLRSPKDYNQQIIISSPEYPTGNIITNFSFLFLILVFVLLVIMSAYNIYIRSYQSGEKHPAKLNFNTKVQLYLNFAFFLPLIVVSIIIVSILNSSNIQETKAYYLEKAQSVANDLMTDVQDYYDQGIDFAELSSTISEIADITQSDINLFDKHGKLLVPSQTYVYENELMNDVVNPQAYAQIIEQKQSKTMLDEAIGSLSYNSAYVSIKSLETGEVLGIVGIPFFGSKKRYEQQVIDVLSKIIQAFAFIMIGLLGVSYISALSLTAPLRLIRQKIRKVSFQQADNEPIEYTSDDEIGLLVNEYNKMLLKLEDSKQALSQQEKESAWREMAKQVAHEIKNPLTPMKLSIQQLERILAPKDERTQKTIRTLLNQIDTLSEIATSFSNFADMPTPKEEKLEIGYVLRQVVHLHAHDYKTDVKLEIPEGDYFIKGDSQLLDRVFNNLIINGIQATPSHRRPQIHISFTHNSDKLIIMFKDNGGGIPEEIQSKVFVPNFTTKSSGSGIGLAISRRAIKHLGGRIWFDTEPGLGTTFFIELPLFLTENGITQSEEIKDESKKLPHPKAN